MMRDCEFYEIHLADYAAGELPRDRREALEAHLSACGGCREELAREIDLRTVLGSLPVAPCPDAVTRGLAALLPLDIPADRGRGAPRPWLRLATSGLVAAALALFVLVPALRDGRPAAAPAGHGAYTQAEVDQARRDVINVLALTAGVLDRSRTRTMTEVFGDRLPGAVSGSLRSPHAPDAHTPNGANGASDTGGQG
ncbi:zf-HC2 domain-containing protein [bacterium]|nr:zf-HC2 domain-containing protein [bacterium]